MAQEVDAISIRSTELLHGEEDSKARAFSQRGVAQLEACSLPRAPLDDLLASLSERLSSLTSIAFPEGQENAFKKLSDQTEKILKKAAGFAWNREEQWRLTVLRDYLRQSALAATGEAFLDQSEETRRFIAVTSLRAFESHFKGPLVEYFFPVGARTDDDPLLDQSVNWRPITIVPEEPCQKKSEPTARIERIASSDDDFYVESYWDLCPTGGLARVDTAHVRIDVPSRSPLEATTDARSFCTSMEAMPGQKQYISVPAGFTVTAKDGDCEVYRSEQGTHYSLSSQEGFDDAACVHRFLVEPGFEVRFREPGTNTYLRHYQTDLVSPLTKAADELAAHAKTQDEKLQMVLNALKRQDLIYSNDPLLADLERWMGPAIFLVREALGVGNCDSLSAHLVNRLRANQMRAVIASGRKQREENLLQKSDGHSRAVLIGEDECGRQIETTSFCNPALVFDTSALTKEERQALIAELLELSPADLFARCKSLRTRFVRRAKETEQNSQEERFREMSDVQSLDTPLFWKEGNDLLYSHGFRACDDQACSVETVSEFRLWSLAFLEEVRSLRPEQVSWKELLTFVDRYNAFTKRAHEITGQCHNDRMNHREGALSAEDGEAFPGWCEWEKGRWTIIDVLRQYFDRGPAGAPKTKRLKELAIRFDEARDGLWGYPAFSDADFFFVARPDEIARLDFDAWHWKQLSTNGLEGLFTRKASLPRSSQALKSIYEACRQFSKKNKRLPEFDKVYTSEFSLFGSRVMSRARGGSFSADDRNIYYRAIAEFGSAYSKGADPAEEMEAKTDFLARLLSGEFLRSTTAGWVALAKSFLQGAAFSGAFAGIVNEDGTLSELACGRLRQHFFNASRDPLYIDENFTEILKVFGIKLSSFINTESDEVREWAAHAIRHSRTARKAEAQVNCPWDDRGELDPRYPASALICAQQFDGTCWLHNEADFLARIYQICVHANDFALLRFVRANWDPVDEEDIVEAYFRHEREFVSRPEGVRLRIMHTNQPSAINFTVPFVTPPRLRGRLLDGVGPSSGDSFVASAWALLEERADLELLFSDLEKQHGEAILRSMRAERFRSAVSERTRFYLTLALSAYLGEDETNRVTQLHSLSRSRQSPCIDVLGDFGTETFANALIKLLSRITEEERDEILRLFDEECPLFDPAKGSFVSSCLRFALYPWASELARGTEHVPPLRVIFPSNRALSVECLRLLSSVWPDRNPDSSDPSFINKVKEFVAQFRTQPSTRRPLPARAFNDSALRMHVSLPKFVNAGAGEKVGARPYRPGDDTSNIDANTSARLDETYVFERADERQDPVHYLLDVEWLCDDTLPRVLPQSVHTLLTALRFSPGTLRIYLRGEELASVNEQDIRRILRSPDPKLLEGFLLDLCSLREKAISLKDLERKSEIQMSPWRLFNSPPSISGKQNSLIVCIPRDNYRINEQLLRSMWGKSAHSIDLL